MNVIIEKSWKERLENEFKKPYFKQVTDFVREEYRTKTIYPPAKLIFNAFDQCPFDKVKVAVSYTHLFFRDKGYFTDICKIL